MNPHGAKGRTSGFIRAIQDALGDRSAPQAPRVPADYGLGDGLLPLPGWKTFCRGSGGLSCPPGAEVVARTLAMALDDARTAGNQLAARFRAYAQANGEPAASARAAAVTAAAQALGQAWLLTGWRLPARSGLASDRAARPDPAGGTDETAQLLAGARLLARAVSALSDRTAPHACAAAGPLPDCLAGVQACLRVAGQQLARAWEPPDNQPPGHGQPPAEDPPHRADPQ